MSRRSKSVYAKRARRHKDKDRQRVEALVTRALPPHSSSRWAPVSDIITPLFRADGELDIEQVWAAMDRMLDDGRMEREEHTDGDRGFHFVHRLTERGDVERDRLCQTETGGDEEIETKTTRRDERDRNIKQGGDVMSSKRDLKPLALKELTLKELIAYYNEITTGTPVKAFPSKAVAIRRIEGATQETASAKKGAKKDAKKGVKKGAKTTMPAKKTARHKTSSKTPKTGPSKLDAIRDLFKGSRKRVSLDDLLAATGWNKHVLHSAMATLRNSKTLEKRLDAAFDRVEQVYVKQ